jgi:hypothetical protein
MAKLILRRLAHSEPGITSLREVALTALSDSLDASGVVLLLVRDDAIRVEFRSDIWNFDDIESRLNRHGITCMA